jgi:hypothetical protein
MPSPTLPTQTRTPVLAQTHSHGWIQTCISGRTQTYPPGRTQITRTFTFSAYHWSRTAADPRLLAWLLGGQGYVHNGLPIPDVRCAGVLDLLNQFRQQAGLRITIIKYLSRRMHKHGSHMLAVAVVGMKREIIVIACIPRWSIFRRVRQDLTF